MRLKAGIVILLSSLLTASPSFAAEKETKSGKSHDATPKERVEMCTTFIAEARKALSAGRLEEALRVLNLCLVVSEDIPEAGAQRVECLHYLYKLSRANSQYSDSERYALQEVEAANKFDHAHETDALNDLAAILRKEGKFELSVKTYEKSLEVAQAQKLPDAAIATIHDNLGLVFQEQRLWDKCLEQHEIAYKIYLKVNGEDNIETAYCQNNLGMAYFGLKDYDKAEANMVKGLAGIVKGEGPQSEMAASAYDNLGAVYSRKGEYTKAAEVQKKALAIFEARLGHDNPDVGIAYSNLCVTYKLEGKINEAREAIEQACKIFAKTVGADHHYTRMAIAQKEALDAAKPAAK